jgi:acyl carrier protein
MDIKDFVANFADQFDDTDPEMITAGTAFHDLEEWSSLIALSVLNMVNKQYGYNMTFDEMKPCVTVEDLFNFVASKVK